MDVALLSPVFWPEVRRGSERFVRDLADGLLAAGDEVRLITSHRGPPSSTVEDGLRVVRVRRPPGAGRLRRRHFEDHLLHLPAAYRALDAHHEDVAHAVYPTDALAAARWGRRHYRPSVLSYMGIPHRQGLANRRLRKELTLRACHEVDAVCVLSEEAGEAMDRWLGVEALVIPPGVDLDAFTPAPDPAAARARVPTILCAADPAEPRKRVALLAEAFALLRRREPDARLLLDARPGAALPTGPGVEGIRLDDRDALVAANRAAWVHVLPSVGEAFGLVLAEALACGTPVVGPNRGVIGEQGERFGGEQDDPALLAAALEAALDRARDPATPAACRAQAERFSLEATVSAYRALYERL